MKTLFIILPVLVSAVAGANPRKMTNTELSMQMASSSMKVIMNCGTEIGGNLISKIKAGQTPSEGDFKAANEDCKKNVAAFGELFDESTSRMFTGQSKPAVREHSNFGLSLVEKPFSAAEIQYEGNDEECLQIAAREVSAWVKKPSLNISQFTSQIPLLKSRCQVSLEKGETVADLYCESSYYKSDYDTETQDALMRGPSHRVFYPAVIKKNQEERAKIIALDDKTKALQRKMYSSKKDPTQAQMDELQKAQRALQDAILADLARQQNESFELYGFMTANLKTGNAKVEYRLTPSKLFRESVLKRSAKNRGNIENAPFTCRAFVDFEVQASPMVPGAIFRTN